MSKGQSQSKSNNAICSLFCVRSDSLRDSDSLQFHRMRDTARDRFIEVCCRWLEGMTEAARLVVIKSMLKRYACLCSYLNTIVWGSSRRRDRR